MSSDPSASPASAAPSVEELQRYLPQYEILEILGVGGMGAVYKARQPKLDRLIAIKTLPTQLDDGGMRSADRFVQEAQAMAKMQHNRIVHIYDFGDTEPGSPQNLQYIVMEYVDGATLFDLIRQKSLSPRHCVAIVTQVCDALHYAHERGVIHRDIKPANIMLGHDGEIKVADFGLAKLMGEQLFSQLTQTKIALGTEDYVSPEALTEGATIDHRADIYALGVLLYEMLTGRVPRGMFQPASGLREGVDSRLDQVIHRAMEQDPADRYQSVAKMWADLERIASSTSSSSSGGSGESNGESGVEKKTRKWFKF